MTSQTNSKSPDDQGSASSHCSSVDEDICTGATGAVHREADFLTEEKCREIAVAVMRHLRVGCIDERNSLERDAEYFSAISDDAFARMNVVAGFKNKSLDVYFHLRNLWLSAKGCADTASQLVDR